MDSILHILSGPIPRRHLDYASRVPLAAEEQCLNQALVGVDKIHLHHHERMRSVDVHAVGNVSATIADDPLGRIVGVVY